MQLVKSLKSVNLFLKENLVSHLCSLEKVSIRKVVQLATFFNKFDYDSSYSCLNSLITAGAPSKLAITI
jgi:hypothetical protein